MILEVEKPVLHSNGKIVVVVVFALWTFCGAIHFLSSLMASLHESVATKICNNNPKRKKTVKLFTALEVSHLNIPSKKKTPEVIISEIVFNFHVQIFK